MNKLSWIELASPELVICFARYVIVWHPCGCLTLIVVKCQYFNIAISNFEMFVKIISQDKTCKFSGRISCTVLLSPKPEFDNIDQSSSKGRKSGFIQISPSRTGPWTTVRLNYATPAACWRLGNDVIASHVTVKDGSRYVTVRSLVSVQNNTDFMLDVCLMSKHSKESIHLLDETGNSDGSRADSNVVFTEEFYETEKYNPTAGWVSCLKFSQDFSEGNIEEVIIGTSFLRYLCKVLSLL